MNEITNIEPQTGEIATRSAPNEIVSAIISMARDPSMDIAKLDALMKMQERMEDRQAERAYSAAFVEMQGKLPRVKKDGTLEYPMDKNNPDGPKRFVANYAKWETIMAAIQPILTECGFALSFKILPRTGDGGGMNVAAVVRHAGGHVEIGEPMPVSLDTSGGKNNAQAYASSLSYGKRHAAFAALNIVTEGQDDDAASLGNRTITEAQVGQIEKLLTQSGADRAKFMDHFGILNLLEMKAGDFVPATNMLNAKIKKAAQS